MCKVVNLIPLPLQNLEVLRFHPQAASGQPLFRPATHTVILINIFCNSPNVNLFLNHMRGRGKADRLAREGARTRPISPEPFLPPSLSRFKSKIRNWIEKRKQTERKVCKKNGTSQRCPEGITDRYVQFVSKLDRKHCRMLVGLLTGISICSTCCTR